MKKVLTIGTATAKQGTKSNGFVKVAFRPDGSEIAIPIMIVNGADDGALLLADAGVHADEFEGMEAIRRVANALNPKKLKGAFVGIPCLNALAFEVGRRISAIDQTNLNRVFPGRADGFITEQIAYVYEHKIVEPLKDMAECNVSFHGGGDIMQVGPHIPYSESPGILGERKADLSKVFGINLLTTCIGGYPPSGTGGSTTVPTKLGIPVVSVEAGGDARCSEEVVNIDTRGLNNLMIYLEMIDGDLILPEKWTWTTGPLMVCKKGGFFLRKVKKTGRFIGQTEVSKSDLIGMTVNYFGEEIERVEAPNDGIIYLLRTLPSVYPGDWYCGFGTVKKVYERSELNL